MLIALRKTMTEKTPARLLMKWKRKAANRGMGENYISICICEDNPVSLEKLRSMLREASERQKVRIRVETIANLHDIKEAIRNDRQYGLILADVDCMYAEEVSVSALLNAQRGSTITVLYSSEQERLLERYGRTQKLNHEARMGFERLRIVLQMCCRERAEQKEIVLPTLRGLRKCRMEDIVYAETWDRGVRLTLIDGQEQVNYCMSELKGMLPEERFIMCHRAFLANIGYVRYVRGRELELTTGCVLPVSKHRLHNVRKRLMR